MSSHPDTFDDEDRELLMRYYDDPSSVFPPTEEELRTAAGGRSRGRAQARRARRNLSRTPMHAKREPGEDGSEDDEDVAMVDVRTSIAAAVAPEAASSPPTAGPPIPPVAPGSIPKACLYWKWKGHYCKYGADCHYLHPAQLRETEVRPPRPVPPPAMVPLSQTFALHAQAQRSAQRIKTLEATVNHLQQKVTTQASIIAFAQSALVTQAVSPPRPVRLAFAPPGVAFIDVEAEDVAPSTAPRQSKKARRRAAVAARVAAQAEGQPSPAAASSAPYEREGRQTRSNYAASGIPPQARIRCKRGYVDEGGEHIKGEYD